MKTFNANKYSLMKFLFHGQIDVVPLGEEKSKDISDLMHVNR